MYPETLPPSIILQVYNSISVSNIGHHYGERVVSGGSQYEDDKPFISSSAVNVISVRDSVRDSVRICVKYRVK